MKIALLTQNADNVKESLDALLPGNVITAFNTVDAMRDHALNSTLKTDILVVEDNGIATDINTLSDGFMKLANIFDYRFFKAKRVIFLNKPNNQSWLNYYNYLKDDLEDKDIEVTISVKLHNVSDIKNMVLEMNKEFSSVKTNDIVVIQKARKAQIQNEELLQQNNDDLGVEVGLPQFNRQQAKDPFRGNTTELDLSADNTKTPEIIVEEDFSVEKEPVIKDKVIMVTGVENSGVSTTSFIMAKSATSQGKVLLIDLDVHNMGLSYLADKIYSKIDGVSTINIEEVYTNSFNNVIQQTMNSDSLHIMTITLKLIRKVEDIEFTVINLIERVKNRYDYIIFDSPLRVLKYYPTLLGTYVDRIILTNIPYTNKVVSMLEQVQKSSLTHLRAYRENKVSVFSVGLLDRNGLKSISRNVCRKYSKAILSKDLPVSGVYVLQKEGYYKPVFFKEMIEAFAVDDNAAVQETEMAKAEAESNAQFEEAQAEFNEMFAYLNQPKEVEQIPVSEVFRRYKK